MGGLRQQWWGSRPVPEQGAERLRIGPLELWLSKEAGQLRVGHRQHPDALDSTLSAEAISLDEAPEELVWVRLAPGAVPSARYTLTPLSADRAMIARPEIKVLIPPGASLLAFVSLPLWLRLEVGLAQLELPIFRPNDTWFGENNIEGELCYACQTSLRNRREMLPTRPHRAITPVTLHNRGDEPLEVRRLRIPAPHLPLLAEPSELGGLETPAISLERSPRDKETSLRIEPAPEGRSPVSSARQANDNAVIRVLNSFLP